MRTSRACVLRAIVHSTKEAPRPSPGQPILIAISRGFVYMYLRSRVRSPISPYVQLAETQGSMEFDALN